MSPSAAMESSYSAVKEKQAIGETLAGAEYNRQRLAPHPKDPYYIHLSDVRLFLSNYEAAGFGSVLDYGCGGSPYRKLFNPPRYVRADHVDCGDIDCVIGRDGHLALPDEEFEMVLSTQVLEHVYSPQDYLKEAWRVLKPGGKLILTTHGTWEDHGCPYDFRRWTRDGLWQELESAGFEVKRVAKLTTGTRAILFLFSKILGEVHDSRFHLSGLAFRLLRRSRFVVPELRHRWMDSQFAAQRVVFGNETKEGIYLALGIEGIKPGRIES
jgi:SAM-dependent methyltransferase